MKCGSKFGPVPENQGAVGRAGWLASFLDLPGAKFFCGKPPTHENSLNFANTCLKLVDTRRGPFVADRGYKHLVEGLDKLYADERNSKIEMQHGLWIVMNILSGYPMKILK